MKIPLVSIIIPNHNHEKWLKICLQCCLRQTYPSIEIVVVDDASTDNSLETVQSFGGRISLVTLEKRSGPGAARNAGLKKARGEFIMFLDADDWIPEDRISLQVETMLHDNTQVCLSHWKRIFTVSFGDLPGPENKAEDFSLLFAETIRDRKWIPVMALLLRRDLVEQVGDWREDMLWNEDREYRYRILRLRPSMSLVPKTLFAYRVHEGPRRSQIRNKQHYLEQKLRSNGDYIENCLLKDYEKGLLTSRAEREALYAFIQQHIKGLQEHSSTVIHYYHSHAAAVYPEASQENFSAPKAWGNHIKYGLYLFLKGLKNVLLPKLLYAGLEITTDERDILRSWSADWYSHIAGRFLAVLK